MGGAGSGRKPARQDPIEQIADSVAAASEAAAKPPPPKPTTPAQKAAAKKLTNDERKEKKRTYPKPSEFAGNPLAMALNKMADGFAGFPEGTAAKVEFGEAWLAVADYYLGGTVDHPLAVAAMATGQLVVAAVAIRGLGKPNHAGQAGAKP